MLWSLRDPLTISITVLVVIATFLAGVCYGSSSKCVKGWDHYARQNTCIKVFQNNLTWEGAQAHCRKLRSTLIQVWDMEKDKFIQGFLLSGNPYWIGIKDANGDGKFKYINGSSLTKMNVWSSAPGKGKCVASDLKPTGWKKMSCTEKHGFLCEESLDCGPLDSCPVITFNEKTYAKYERLVIDIDKEITLQCDLTGKTDDVVEIVLACGNTAFTEVNKKSLKKTFLITGEYHDEKCHCFGVHKTGTRDATSVIINFMGGIHLADQKDNENTHCDPNKKEKSFSHKLNIYSNPRPGFFYLHKDDKMVKYKQYDLEFFRTSGILYEVNLDVYGMTWSTKTKFQLFIGDEYGHEMTYTFGITDTPCLVIPGDPKTPTDGNEEEGSYFLLWILLLVVLVVVGAVAQWHGFGKQGVVTGEAGEEVIDPEDPAAEAEKAAEDPEKMDSSEAVWKKSNGDTVNTEYDEDEDSFDRSYSDSYTGSYNTDESWSTVIESVV